MHPDQTREGEDTDDDCAGRIEDDECKAHEDSVCNETLPPLVDQGCLPVAVAVTVAIAIAVTTATAAVAAAAGTLTGDWLWSSRVRRGSGGRRRKRIEGAAAFGFGQVECEGVLVVVLVDIGRLRVTLQWTPIFDRPDPVRVSRVELHSPTRP